jgi:hypothetical protein
MLPTTKELILKICPVNPAKTLSACVRSIPNIGLPGDLCSAKPISGSEDADFFA